MKYKAKKKINETIRRENLKSHLKRVKRRKMVRRRRNGARVHPLPHARPHQNSGRMKSKPRQCDKYADSGP